MDNYRSSKSNKISQCVKSVCIWSFSGPYFLAFGLNTERYFVSLRIQSECGKIRTKQTPNTDSFNVVLMEKFWKKALKNDKKQNLEKNYSEKKQELALLKKTKIKKSEQRLLKNNIKKLGYYGRSWRKNQNMIFSQYLLVYSYETIARSSNNCFVKKAQNLPQLYLKLLFLFRLT